MDMVFGRHIRPALLFLVKFQIPQRKQLQIRQNSTDKERPPEGGLGAKRRIRIKTGIIEQNKNFVQLRGGFSGAFDHNIAYLPLKSKFLPSSASEELILALDKFILPL